MAAGDLLWVAVAGGCKDLAVAADSGPKDSAANAGGAGTFSDGGSRTEEEELDSRDAWGRGADAAPSSDDWADDVDTADLPADLPSEAT